MKKIICTLIFLNGLASQAQNSYRSYVKDNVSYREHPLDITKMKVELNFDPYIGLVKGKVSHSFIVLQQNVDSIFFDAPDIKILSATLNNRPLKFKTTKTGLWVKPNQTLHWDENGTIQFEYEASPRRGIYFIGWNIPENKEVNPFAVRRQIWTQGQGIDNRAWIPMYDDMNDKFITETIVTFDKDYEVLSNGVLQSKTLNANNTYTWHYAMSKPHAGYLLMLGIGKYDIKKTKSGSGVPMNLYYYPEFEERAEPTYRHSEMMVDFLEKETGIAYPWESYSQIMVQDFLYGAMENTTATIFGDFFNVDNRAFLDRNYVGVNCHELTHQWFGDFVTARNGHDTWLQESFATYYPKILSRELYGENEYNWQRRSEQNASLEASKKDRNPIRSQGGTARVYQKGSSVISMFNYVLGEEQWKRALNHYLKTHAYANVETNDIQQAIQDKLGIDMTWFIEEWLQHGGEPQYTIKYEDISSPNGNRQTKIHIAQTHQRDEVVGLFKMPINFEVHYKDGSKDKQMKWIEDENEVVIIPNKQNKAIDFVLFDPNSMVLKSLVFDKNYNELSAQVLRAPNMLDRYDALIALKSTDIEKKRALLQQVFEQEKFHQMKAEVVNQLINDESSASLLQSVFTGSKTSAKLAAIKGLKEISPSWKNVLINALQDSSYEVVQNTLEKLCQNFSTETSTFLASTNGVQGMNNSVQIKWHEINATNNEGNKKSLDKLIDFSSNAWEFRTRINAFNSLKALGVCNNRLVENLFDAMLSTNGRLASPAAQLAEYLTQQTVNKKMFSTYFQKKQWEKKEQDLLKKQMNFL